MTEAKQAESKPEPKQGSKQVMMAVIQIRSMVGVKPDIRMAADSLRLRRKNVCVVRKLSPSMKGMIIKVKDYITYGEIDDATYKMLVEKRGEKDADGIKPFFRLNPPKKGYGRKGIKKAYSIGGALGYRGSDINELIRRMI